MTAARIRALLVLLAIGALAAATIPRLEVATDVTHFMPEGQDRQLAELSRDVARSDLNRTITLTVKAPDSSAAAEVGRELGERLREVDGVAWVRSGPDADLERSFYELYFPRRLGFIDDRPERIDEQLTLQGLRERARDLKRRLSQPTGAFVRKIAPKDPWLLFVRHIERMQKSLRGGMRVKNGSFVTGEDGRWAVVWVATEATPFDAAAQRPIQAAIDREFAALDREHDGALEIEQAGVHRIAIRAEERIRRDITRVSVAGSVGAVLLILLLFRSPRALLLGATPIVAGFAAAAAVVQLVFGEVHGLTFAFGATLIGVAIDYVAHYLCHHHLAPDEGGAVGTVRRIWPGLALGAATTVAGLAGLAWTSFPGIREMAVFSTVGVATALAVTRWVLPPWTPAAPKPSPVLAAVARGAERALGRLRRAGRVLWLFPAAGVALAAAGAPGIDWNDDIRALMPPDQDLLAEDERVRSRVSRADAGRFVIATGDDVEQALARNDEVHVALERARQDGLVQRHRSLHPLLWSASLQRANREAVPEDAWSRTTEALEAEGFVADRFEPFRQTLKAPFDPLRPADLEDTALAAMTEPFQIPTRDGMAVLTFVHGVSDAGALAERLERIEGVRWFDQAAFMERAYGTLRTRTLQLVGAGLVVVFLLVLLRYRRVRPAAAAFVPALLAAFTTLGVLSLAGIELHLLHVVALLLVLSMGVDYGIFMVESGEHQAPTLVGLSVACASTIVSFGVLGMSDHPALQALGLTAAVGVLLALVLAPTAALLLGTGAGEGPDAG